MLASTRYDKDYIDSCRSRIAAQLAAYDELVAAGGKRLQGSVAAFEPLFFNNLVQVLDHLFVHRLRNAEGKDGNPLNEVRVLCGSLMLNDGRLAADKQIKLQPESSVLGYEVGDEILLSRDDFGRLAERFFDEIERRYGG